MKYAYYPGCASQEITSESDETTRKIADILGIGLEAMPAANCCGAGLLKDYDYELMLSLNARVFAQAEAMEKDILTICSTCLMVMRTANQDLKKDPALLKTINKVLGKAGLKYSGNIEVKHLLWVLCEDYGLDKLKKKVKRPISWLKVAPFYGCHSLRPSDALVFDDPEKPWSLDWVISALGGNPVEYVGKTKCCGFQVDLVSVETAVEMTGTRLMDAKGRGADCMVTPCPFCHINLDNYQGMAEKKMSRKIDIPVFHLSQLVALALGIDAAGLGVSRHLVSAEKLLKGI